METPNWNNDFQEREMKAAFDEQSAKLLADSESFVKKGDEVKIGFESEVALCGSMPQGEIEQVRDRIVAEPGFEELLDKELGVAQIESRTPPVNIRSVGGFQIIEEIYQGISDRLAELARENGCSILRCGTNPFLPVRKSPRTSKPKYQTVPDYYNFHRRKDAVTLIGLGRNMIDIGDAAIVSLFQSFQVNLQANSFEDAVDKMNRSLFIAPYLLGLSANSRYLECFDTELQDLRMASWEKSHDSGMQDIRLSAWEGAFNVGGMSRVGLPERYFADMEDYLARAGSFPFILNAPSNAFNIAIGMTWLDARIKFIGNSTVVEIRLLPTQPTVEEELMLALFYIGRLRYSQMTNEPILPIEIVRANRQSAMYFGMSGYMYFCWENNRKRYELLTYRDGIEREIRKAVDGLKSIGLEYYLDLELIEDILNHGTPSDRLAREFDRNSGIKSKKQRMERAMRATGMLTP